MADMISDVIRQLKVQLECIHGCGYRRRASFKLERDSDLEIYCMSGSWNQETSRFAIASLDSPYVFKYSNRTDTFGLMAKI